MDVRGSRARDGSGAIYPGRDEPRVRALNHRARVRLECRIGASERYGRSVGDVDIRSAGYRDGAVVADKDVALDRNGAIVCMDPGRANVVRDERRVVGVRAREGSGYVLADCKRLDPDVAGRMARVFGEARNPAGQSPHGGRVRDVNVGSAGNGDGAECSEQRAAISRHCPGRATLIDRGRVGHENVWRPRDLDSSVIADDDVAFDGNRSVVYMCPESAEVVDGQNSAVSVGVGESSPAVRLNGPRERNLVARDMRRVLVVLRPSP